MAHRSQPMSRTARRAALLAIALAVAALSVVAVVVWASRGTAPGRPGHRASERPDIVLIITDDQRWDTLWAMPNVRRLLVDRGVTFTNAFVVNPLCCPSRASTLTGDYSHTTGVYANLGPHGGFTAFDDRSTLATWLHEAGYETGLFGKYLNLYPGKYVPPGWDDWAAFVMVPDVARHYYDYALSEGATIRHYGEAPGDYSTNVLADDAVGFIRSAESPMFLYFTPWAPHTPPIAAPGDDGTFANLEPARPSGYDEADVSDKPRYVRIVPPIDPARMRALDAERRGTYQTLLAVDRAMGRIVAALRETGRLEHTMIVFTSDNGFAWGEHRWRAKQVPYEESIRVPLVISYPPLTESARIDGRMALNIDLAPTIAQVAGVPDGDPDGRSLVPILAGARKAPWRHEFLIEHAHVYSRPAPPSYCAVRTEHTLYAAYSTGEREYYDLRRDPDELENRAGDPATREAQAPLRASLHELCDPAPPGMTRP